MTSHQQLKNSLIDSLLKLRGDLDNDTALPLRTRSKTAQDMREALDLATTLATTLNESDDTWNKSNVLKLLLTIQNDVVDPSGPTDEQTTATFWYLQELQSTLMRDISCLRDQSIQPNRTSDYGAYSLIEPGPENAAAPSPFRQQLWANNDLPAPTPTTAIDYGYPMRPVSHSHAGSSRKLTTLPTMGTPVDPGKVSGTLTCPVPPLPTAIPEAGQDQDAQFGTNQWRPATSASTSFGLSSTTETPLTNDSPKKRRRKTGRTCVTCQTMKRPCDLFDESTEPRSSCSNCTRLGRLCVLPNGRLNLEELAGASDI